MNIIRLTDLLSKASDLNTLKTRSWQNLNTDTYRDCNILGLHKIFKNSKKN